MRLMKRWLSGLLCLVLLLGLLPTAALAEGETAAWATEAVTTLNRIYGSDGSSPFSASTDVMTEGDAASIASSVGWTTTKVTSESSTQLSRSKACAVLAEVFDLPIGNKTAIEYLYEQNIVTGKSPEDLAENETVTKAEFAVLTYRVLNAVGGGMGSKDGWPEPGSEGYTAWMYLAVRKCVPFEMTYANTVIQNATIPTYTGSSYKENNDRATIDGGTTQIYDVITADKSGQEIWNAWEDALQDTNLGGSSSFTAPTYQESDTLLEAAIRMVEARNDARPVIFHDVNSDNWFYDGIMYLVNNDIVVGYGDGKFGPNDVAPRYELAVLLTNVEGVTLSTESGLGRVTEAIQYVVGEGYMTGTVSEEEGWNPTTDSYWGQPTTREEATVAILKMIANKENIITANNNLSILDRFSDKNQITSADSKPYLAYAVSVGLLSGTSANTLAPDSKVSRAQVGVLLYRTLIGLDASKMHDYEQNVQNALG